MSWTREEWLELADRLDHASKVAWRWLKDDNSPFERDVTLRIVARFSAAAAELRAAHSPDSAELSTTPTKARG